MSFFFLISFFVFFDRADKTLQDIVYKLVPGLFKGRVSAIVLFCICMHVCTYAFIHIHFSERCTDMLALKSQCAFRFLARDLTDLQTISLLRRGILISLVTVVSVGVHHQSILQKKKKKKFYSTNQIGCRSK